MSSLNGGKLTMYLVISICYTKTSREKKKTFVVFTLSISTMCPNIALYFALHTMWISHLCAMAMCVLCVFTYAEKETLLPGVFGSFEIIIIIIIRIIILSIRFTCTANIYPNCKWLLTILILDSSRYLRIYSQYNRLSVHNFQSNPTKNKWRKKQKATSKEESERKRIKNSFYW